MMKYPIGIQSFEKIAKGKLRYIDKTGYVYDLAHRFDYVFLSRPRRFGKSLLASTLHCYFEGQKDLFEGFEAARLEHDWVKHPVLHFDMSTAKHMESERLERELGLKLSAYEKVYGKNPEEVDCNQRLQGLITRAKEQTGQPVVVIIDEYDAPLLDVLGDKEKLAANREVMRNFYSPLKSCDNDLRFVFITGITKFSQLSIFSEINNLQNISMMPEYAAICGITSEELHTQFSDDVDRLAERLDLTREDAFTKLREHYDGYHFSKKSPDIYNPYSLVKALDNGDFGAFWFTSGTPTFLIEQMRHFGVSPQELGEPIKAMPDEFDAPTEDMETITPLLYQSGYLTIKDYDPELMEYTLGIPNLEVRSGLMKSLVSYVADGRSAPPLRKLIRDMQRAFVRDDIGQVMELIKVFFSSIPYTNGTKSQSEGHFQSLLYVMFSLLCDYVDVEVRTPRGRCDLVMNARNKIYIIEVKIGKDADAALEQIDLNSYGERFLIEGKPVVRVGVNFDAEQARNITDWQVVQQ